jgi:cysteine desulfurase/selenocysteine lyase
MPIRDAAKIRQDFPILARKVGGNPLVHYPDSAATSQKPAVMIERMRQICGSSIRAPRRGTP